MERTNVILVIFGLTYLGIAMGRIPGLKLNRPGIALLGAIALMIFGGVTTADAVSWVNWPTIALLFGFFVISAQLRLSGFYDKVAGAIADRLDHPAIFLLVLVGATAGLSAFLNNDIVCFAFTPIVAAALLRKQINPLPFLIAIAIASNFGAAATLVGNAQNMMIGQIAHLSFGRYLIWSIAPVLLSLTAATGIIWVMSRNHLHQSRDGLPRHSPATAGEGVSNDHENDPPQATYPFNTRHTVKGLIILVVVIGLFFSSVPREIIALAAAGIHLASAKFRTDDLLGLVDWPILILFMGLFVVAGAFQSTGCGEQAVHWLARGGFNLNAPGNLILTTTVLSNLISNSAAVMLLLKFANLTQPVVPYVLAVANSFGGNLIVIGSVANIIVVQEARAMGIKIGFWDFARLGIPVTLVALAILFGWAVLIG